MNKLFIALVVTASAVSGAKAGTAAAGNIISPYFMQTGALLVSTDASQSGAPSCATAIPSRWAIDATTPAGKLQATAVLTAYAMGKKIATWGAGTCSVWADTEGISFLQVIN